MANGIKLAHSGLHIAPVGTRFDDPATLTVPLTQASAQSDTIDLFEDGWVDEQTQYVLGLEVSCTRPIRMATLAVDEADELHLELVQKQPRSVVGGFEYAYEIKSDPDGGGWNVKKPFALTCGFARVLVRICVEENSWVELASQDIVALTRQSIEQDHIRGMYEELLETSDNLVGDWMFSKSADLHGDSTDWSSESLQEAMSAMKSVLVKLQTHLFDEDENWIRWRAIALDIAQTAQRLIAEIENDNEKNQELEIRLSEMRREAEQRYHDHRSLPAYAVVSCRIARESAYIERLKDLKTEAHAMAQMVAQDDKPEDIPFENAAEHVMGTDAGDLRAAYEIWMPFREIAFTREARALHAAKPDKLYEYYALYRILKWLVNAGFTLDFSYEKPVDTFYYSYERTYSKFMNERRCANTYHLKRGDQSLTLYYQPVIYGDIREENGIVLHRTIAAQPFDLNHSHPDAAWTPDIILVTSDGADSKTYALDAKYRNLYELAGLNQYGAKDHRVDTSVFEDQIRKYKTDLASDNGRGIDAVWLVCGRGYDLGTLLYRKTEWAQNVLPQSGLAPLSYELDDSTLDQMMESLGIAPLIPNSED